jgi:ADP-ribose pyrophosphatase YjhB (NUDIX family)
MPKQHFTATGIVFNNKNEILMVKHKKLRVWLPPGGHIEENELPDKAVLREILEETGIKATIISNKRNINLTNNSLCEELETPFIILLEDIEGDEKHKHIDLIYLCTAIEETLKPNNNENNEVGWFSYKEITRLKTYENVKKTILQAINDK